VSSPWRREEHINVLELRAVLTAMRWCNSVPPALNHRVLLFCDSAVVVAALAKGRSLSRALSALLRRLAALLLVSGMRLCPVWVPSQENPADAASRGFRV
jgi:hypothetical protein